MWGFFTGQVSEKSNGLVPRQGVKTACGSLETNLLLWQLVAMNEVRGSRNVTDSP